MSETKDTAQELPVSKRFIDHTGKQYGVLFALSYAGKDQHSNSLWNVRCECGNEKIVLGVRLTHGANIACQCNRGSKFSNTCEYKIWSKMKSRCSDKKGIGHERYGGRGIKVCERWASSFENFLADMGPRPSAKHSVERKDRDGDYCPENCIWALPAVQARNTSRNVWITINGETKLIQDWANVSGVGRTTIIMRIKAGWDHERAVFEPVKKAARKAAADCDAKCVINDCNAVAFCRGLCTHCYHTASTAIRKGKVTWDELIRLGLATQTSGKKPSLFSIAFGKIEQK